MSLIFSPVHFVLSLIHLNLCLKTDLLPLIYSCMMSFCRADLSCHEDDDDDHDDDDCDDMLV